MKTFAVFLRSK